MADTNPISRNAGYLSTRLAQSAQGLLNKVPGQISGFAREIFPGGTGVRLRGGAGKAVSNLGKQAFTALTGINPYLRAARVAKNLLENKQTRQLILGISLGIVVFAGCFLFMTFGIFFQILELFGNNPLSKLQEYLQNNDSAEYRQDFKLKNCEETKERLQLAIDCKTFAESQNI